tara:strand:+ start:1275 stop:1754 length:480 start_codon:yes stop_codon:yes gene_type:complete
MTKTPIDYSNCVIYKIVCKDLDNKNCYIGHTTQLSQRIKQHKYDYKYEKGPKYNYKLYRNIRDSDNGIDDYDIVLVEKYPCANVYEAKARERYFYETLNANMNTQNPCRSAPEYIEEHKEEIRLKKARRERCQCGGTYTMSHRARHYNTYKHMKGVSNL